jgi:hypothetical protein
MAMSVEEALNQLIGYCETVVPDSPKRPDPTHFSRYHLRTDSSLVKVDVTRWREYLLCFITSLGAFSLDEYADSSAAMEEMREALEGDKWLHCAFSFSKRDGPLGETYTEGVAFLCHDQANGKYHLAYVKKTHEYSGRLTQ